MTTPSQKVNQRAKELLGREIELKELWEMKNLLYFYIKWVNDGNGLHRRTMCLDDEIESDWISRGYLVVLDDRVYITKQFWMAASELVYLQFIETK